MTFHVYLMHVFGYSLTLLLEFISYLRLKYVEPDTPRPFVVPGGNWGAWLVTLPKTLVIMGVLVCQKAKIWKTALSFNVIFALIYLVWQKYHKHSKYSPSLPPPPHISRKMKENSDDFC